MATNVITVDYEIERGSPVEHISHDGASVEVKYLCAWRDRITFVKEMLGYVTGSSLYLPDEYKGYDSSERLYGLYAKAATIEPVGAIDQTTGNYTLARVTITYGKLDYDTPDTGEGPWPPEGTPPEEMVFVSETLEPASEFMTLPRKGLYLGTGANKVSLENLNLEPPAKIIRMVEWVYTIHQYNRIPEFFFTLPGKVNDGYVHSRSLDITFPAETLLCGNPTLKREITTLGKTTWTITLRFTHRNAGTFDSPKGWNYFPRTDSLGASGEITWEQIYDGSGTAVKIYEPADFTQVPLIDTA